MSATVDKRIVEMQFDNADFEKNIKSSENWLNKFKKSLDLEGSAKGLEAIETAARRVTWEFSALGKLTDTVVRKITTDLYNAFAKMKGMVDQLTIEPVYSGFQEYETQINAIQTILSNTRDAMTKAGYSEQERLDIVNDRLDQLNHYADKTIYNFTEMTRNIGTFTAAGVELDTAVNSIQGIANLAAVSGSTSEQASRAMYQLSQAISSGTVRLLDWNSVVNAGMGGEVFQKALKRTAKSMGVVVDESKSFRDSLQDGWLSSEVLTTTLDQFSWDFEQMAKDMGYTAENMEEGIAKAMEAKKAELTSSGYTADEADEIMQLAKDATEAATKVKTLTQLFDTMKEAVQSGWTQTWEYIIGDFNEAKQTLTAVSDYFGDIIGKSADARNAIVKEWRDNGGRNLLFNQDETKGPLGALWNIVYGIQNLIQVAREGFSQILPPATAETLLNVTKRIQQATASFKAWTDASENTDKIRRFIGGAASLLNGLKNTLGYVVKGFTRLIGIGGSAGKSLLDLAASFGDWATNAVNAVRNSEHLQAFLTGMKSVIDSIRDSASGLFKMVKSWLPGIRTEIQKSGFFSGFVQRINSFIGKIPGGVAKLKAWITSIREYVASTGLLKTAWTNVKDFFAPLLSGLEDFQNRIETALKAFFDEDVTEKTSLTERLRARLGAFASAFTGWYEDVTTAVGTVWAKIRSYISNFFTNTIPGFFNSQVAIGQSILERIISIDWLGILEKAAGIFLVFESAMALRGIAKAGRGIKNIGKAMKTMAEGLEEIGEKGLRIVQKRDSLGNTLLKIAGSIAILVGAVYVLAKMDNTEVAKGMGLIAVLAGELILVSARFKKIDIDGRSFLQMAASIALMVIPLKILASMDPADALRGILAIGLILAELAAFTRFAGSGFEKKTAFISLAIGLNLMVLAVRSLVKLPLMDMVKGVAGLGVLMAEMAFFMQKTSNVGKISGLIAMALAMNLMVFAVRRMGKISTKELAKGVLALGGMMLSFAAMAQSMKGINLGTAVLSIVALAATLVLFIEAFKQMENMDADSMLKMATSISEILLALSVAAKVISMIPATGAFYGLAGFTLIVAGIGLIAKAMYEIERKWPGTTEAIERGGDMMRAIGNAIGQFIGGIHGGLNRGFNLPQIGSDLSNFMSNVSGFIDGAKQIDTDIAARVGSLAGAILAISGTEVIESLATLFNGEKLVDSTTGEIKGRANAIQSFASHIKQLGNGLMEYAKSVSGIKDIATKTDYKTVEDTATSLAGVLQKIPNNSLLAKLVSFHDVTQFITDIKNLATGLKTYSETISGFKSGKGMAKPEDLKSAIDVANDLTALADNVPEVSILEHFKGWSDLKTFSTDIQNLATGLKTYSETISGFKSGKGMAKPEDLKSAIDVANDLTALADNVPEVSILEHFKGWSNLKTFSSDIQNLATGLKTYSETISGFASGEGMAKPEDLKSAIDVATSLSTLADSLPDSGFLAWFLGNEKDLSAFATGAGELGTGLATFSTNAKNAESIDIDKIISVADAIRTFSESITLDTLTYTPDNLYDNPLIKFSESLGAFGANFQTFAAGISGAAVASSNWEIIKLIIESFTAVGNALKDADFDAEDIMQVGYTLAHTFADSMVVTITDSSGTIVEAVGAIATTVEGTVGVWFTAGANLSQGLANGILSRRGAVASAAFSVAAAGANAVHRRWDEHSPSKVGEELGMYFDLGIANGLETYSRVVSAKADTMGKNVVDSAKTLLRGVDGSMFDNIDPNPTIRPVMDLTNIQNGVGQINRMFNENRSINGGLFRNMNVNRTISGLQFDGSRIAGGQSNKDVISEIRATREEFGTLKQAVASMRVVLDSGELVGATSHKMDTQLGTLAMRRGRGN